MKQFLFIGVASLLVLLAGCQDTALEGLEGRWSGKIACFEATSDITMGLTVEGEVLVGTAQIRNKDQTTEWDIRGTPVKTCNDDICRWEQDCPSDTGELRKCGVNPVCEAAVKQRPGCSGDGGSGMECDPCLNCQPCLLCEKCDPQWLPITFTFKDINVQLPDPWLKIWRYGNTFLKGTIQSFCLDEENQVPGVELSKD
jgi:hypothetical protein